MTDIRSRKDEHLDIVLSGAADADLAVHPFDRLAFVPEAFPTTAKTEIDLSTEFLGFRLSAPLLISAMTGGPARAEAINAALAEAASARSIALAVGSQRVAIEDAGQSGLGRSLRQRAKGIPLLANIGAAQVAIWKDPAKTLKAVEMIEADALIVHFNALQEALQPGGDTDWRGLAEALEALAARSPVPLIAKEVGCGITGATAKRLVDLGFSVIDVAGRGGTSWAAVERHRADTMAAEHVAAPFANWGLATPEAVSDVRTACPATPIIASGGIRDGHDAAKAIRLGANLVGQAAHYLEPALTGTNAVASAIDVTCEQLRVVCFCTGATDLRELCEVPLRRA